MRTKETWRRAGATKSVHGVTSAPEEVDTKKPDDVDAQTDQPGITLPRL
jgi:hypothetical protein